MVSPSNDGCPEICLTENTVPLLMFALAPIRTLTDEYAPMFEVPAVEKKQCAADNTFVAEISVPPQRKYSYSCPLFEETTKIATANGYEL
mmetsp:Transcript_1715/g.6268  ORF Transcript_1715/g.6268 Transcript_1715/m.6268 type:complete len:90 (+) Transcript_1715:2060-2329(+)